VRTVHLVTSREIIFDSLFLLVGLCSGQKNVNQSTLALSKPTVSVGDFGLGLCPLFLSVGFEASPILLDLRHYSGVGVSDKLFACLCIILAH
jgi:hypothetical protein